MSWLRTCIALFLVLFIKNAVSNDSEVADGPFVFRQLQVDLLADSGDNPWALPDPWQQREPPSYITNPRYVMPEDLEPKQKADKAEQYKQQGQTYRPGYGPPYNMYNTSPLPGMPYGDLPGLMINPGIGGQPYYGMPFSGGAPGFDGGPLPAPYRGRSTVPYENVTPYSNQKD